MNNPLDHSFRFTLPPEFLKQFAVIGEHMRVMNAQFAETGAKIAEAIQRIDQTLPSNVRELARHGWFISWWHTPLPALYPIAELFRAGKVDDGHRHLCDHFNDICAEITKDLVASFPSRSSILQSAFAAHDSGAFALSVPVFLTQADGIAREILGVSVYTRRGQVRKTMSAAIQRIDPAGIDEPILRLVLEDLPLTASDDSPDYLPDSLNRHAILHGTDVNYATRINSLRAISWLQYAAHFHETARWSATTSEVEQGVPPNGP
jgi:hypothetical protein